ncbi:MAG: class IV adenylate cyclase [Candidatus Omnitrophica bacterium]|nr:class IV adenylate cyclase [Candidatus Omnitrophota bacterium]
MKFLEIEQKYRLKDPRKVRALLKKAGAKKIRQGTEFNEFFDKNGFLRDQKVALRLRRHGGGQAVLTLKGPRLKSRFSKRMEVETSVDYKAAKALLAFFGCARVMHYQKKRESYRLGRALVTLDLLPGFGWFLEIEARPCEITRIAVRLGLRPSDRELRSYLYMMFHWKH